jgi:LacI family transcriptional regulator
MTTMADVAREAGVSTTTVSHVLNGTRPVNQNTIKRVHAAIERTGYVPNSIARALTGARTKSIGLAINGLSNPYFMSVIAAVEAEAGRRGHTLLLADTHDEPGKELQMVQELILRRVDGLLLAPSAGAEENALRYLSQQSIPVVLLDRFVAMEIDQVGTENEEPTAELVQHLATLGHTRIGLIAGLEGLSTTDERITGYIAALKRSDLPLDRELIAFGGSRHEPARRATHQLLDLGDPPTAIVAANNAMAIGVLHTLRDRGLSVPGDIALVAFDDFEWSDLFHPRLTVIAQPVTEIGAQAVSLLLSRLDDPDREPQSIRLQPTFVHRESCGCAVRADATPTQRSAEHRDGSSTSRHRRD